MSLIIKSVSAGGKRFRILHADTYEELPTSGLSVGDRAFAVDTLLEYVATSATVWAPLAKAIGTPDGTKFLRDDYTWQAVEGGGGTPREDCIAQWNVSITKTNIGTSFVNVYTQTNSDGKSVQIDTNGKTEVKLYVLWNKVGSGTQTVQVLEVGTANVLISMNVVSGQNVSALTAIPAGLANAVKFYVLQAKSTTAADDPIFEGARIYLK